MRKTAVALLCTVLAVHAAAEIPASQEQPVGVEQERTLTKGQSAKLKAPLVREQGGIYQLKVFSKLTFTNPVMFDEKSLNEIVIKQLATMKKGAIHKEMFVAIASSLGDQLMQSMFMNSVYMGHLKQIDNFIDRPMRTPDLTIELEFQEEGVVAKIYSEHMSREQFLNYAAMFNTRVR
jgi:hypothetical protein